MPLHLRSNSHDRRSEDLEKYERFHSSQRRFRNPRVRFDESDRLSRVVDDQRAKIRDLCEQIQRWRADVERSGRIRRRLEEELRAEQRTLAKMRDELQQQLDTERRHVNDLSNHTEKLKESLEEQAVAIELGRKLFVQNVTDMQELRDANEHLNRTVDHNQERIRVLEERTEQLVDANPDVMRDLALESQAERTLGLVKGLQTDISERDDTINHLQAMVTARDDMIRVYDKREQQSHMAVADMAQRLEAADGRAAEATSRLMEQVAQLRKALHESERLRSSSPFSA